MLTAPDDTGFVAIETLTDGSEGDASEQRRRAIAARLQDGWRSEDEMAEEVRAIAGLEEWRGHDLFGLLMQMRGEDLILVRKGGTELCKNPDPPPIVSFAEAIERESDAMSARERERRKREQDARARLGSEAHERLLSEERRFVQEVTAPLRARVDALEAMLDVRLQRLERALGIESEGTDTEPTGSE
jgi:hypothetical protein